MLKIKTFNTDTEFENFINENTILHYFSDKKVIYYIDDNKDDDSLQSVSIVGNKKVKRYKSGLVEESEV